MAKTTFGRRLPVVEDTERGPSRGRSRSPSRSGRQFRREVEGLRAVAVLEVFASHLFGKPVGGFTGVDVFFVISGFLITGLLLREYDRTGRISIKGFYVRRARRILPGAVLVLLVSALSAHFMFYATRAHETLVDILWAGGFFANVHFAATGTDYFHADQPPSPVQHFWSLSVEEQFYVVWPLLLFALSYLAAKLGRRFAHRTLVFVIGSIVIGLFAWGVQQTRADSATAYFLTTARAWELGVGAVLALVLSHRTMIINAVRVPALLLGLALIAYSAVNTTDSGRFPAPAALFAVTGTALVIIGGTGPDLGLVMWPLTNPASRYVGRVSYSLYLWHWPVIVFLPTLMPVHDAYFDIMAICAATAFTAISFHFIEDPLRRMDYPAALRMLRGAATGRTRLWHRFQNSKGYRRQGYIALASLCVFVVGLLAFSLQPPPIVKSFAPAPLAANDTPAKASVPGEIVPPTSITQQISAALSATSFPKLNPSISKVADAHGPEWKTCGNVSAATLSQCTFPATGAGAAKKLVVLGDSFGIAWTPTMRAAQAHGYTVYELTHSQCPAVDENFSEMIDNNSDFTAQCNAARRWYVSEIRKLKPDVVVIGNYDAMLNNLADHRKGQAAIDEWSEGAQRIIDQVKAAGVKRVVWMTSPPPSANLADCDQSASATPSQCVHQIDPTDTWSLVTSAERTVARHTGITLLDTQLFFCATNDYCPAFIGNTPTHTEGHHLTGAYAKQIGPDIVPYVLGVKRSPT